MKPDDLCLEAEEKMPSAIAWPLLFRGLRIWRDKAEAQRKEVEAYELFECHRRVFSANVNDKG